MKLNQNCNLYLGLTHLENLSISFSYMDLNYWEQLLENNKLDEIKPLMLQPEKLMPFYGNSTIFSMFAEEPAFMQILLENSQKNENKDTLL